MSNTLNKNNLVKLTEFEMKNLSNTHAISSLDVYKDISTDRRLGLDPNKMILFK